METLPPGVHVDATLISLNSGRLQCGLHLSLTHQGMDTGPQEGSCGVWHQGIGGKSCVLQGQASMDLTCSGTSCRRAIIMGSWAFGGQVGTLNSVMFHISILCSFCSVAGHIVLLGDHCSPEGEQCSGERCVSNGNHMTVRTQGFPAAHFIVTR